MFNYFLKTHSITMMYKNVIKNQKLYTLQKEIDSIKLISNKKRNIGPGIYYYSLIKEYSKEKKKRQ